MAREKGVTPATIAVIEGCLKVGLSYDELKLLAEKNSECYKFSSYDLPVAQGLKLTGSTTVAGTSYLAHKAGLKVFATGGIGGVHDASTARMDISHDLKALSELPIVVVSAGAKCILDLDSTVEQLETLGVNLVGWKTCEFPAFYYRNSGLKIPYQVDDVEQVASIAEHLDKSALLVANPVPKEAELERTYVEEIIENAKQQAIKLAVTGKQSTPFLLSYLCEKSQGKTLECNLALIKNNVKLACEISRKL